MHKIFKRNGDADLFIFLGDGERDLDSLRVQYLDKKIVNVSGNCDFASLTPENDIYMTDDGIKIFFTPLPVITSNIITYKDIFHPWPQVGREILYRQTFLQSQGNRRTDSTFRTHTLSLLRL